MIDVNDIKKGTTLQYEGNIFRVVDFMHVKPGKGAAFMKTKMQNLRTGATIESTFNTNVRFDDAKIDRIKVQFLYADTDSYNFMDVNTYDQFELRADQVGDNKNFLKEGMEVDITKFENEILGISVPEKVVFTVISTEPAVKGNTTNNTFKDATIETGFLVKVPLFIEEGEEIIVTTEDGKYYSRAK